MRLRTRHVGVLMIAVAVVAVGILAVGWVSHWSFEQRIKALISTSPTGDTVSLGAAVGDKWERAFVFLAYDSVADINAQLGFEGFGPLDQFVAGDSDGDQLLVFVDRDSVVGYVQLTPESFVFAPELFTSNDGSAVMFDPRSDQFRVRRDAASTVLTR